MASRANPYISALVFNATSSVDYMMNAPEGRYLPALTGNPMLSGVNSGLFANPIDQMRYDGILPEKPLLQDGLPSHPVRLLALSL